MRDKVRIRPRPGYDNVYEIRWLVIKGKVSATFKPDETKRELARVRRSRNVPSNADVVLNTDGSVLFDGFVDESVQQGHVEEVVYFDMPEKERLVFLLTHSVGRNTQYKCFDCPGQRRLEALWWLTCFHHNDPESLRKATMDKKFVGKPYARRLIKEIGEASPRTQDSFYAAIAYSPSTRKCKYEFECENLWEAVDSALKRVPAEDARIVAWSRNGYCALVLGKDGEHGWAWATNSKSAAISRARKECQKRTTTKCEEPVWVFSGQP